MAATSMHMVTMHSLWESNDRALRVRAASQIFAISCAADADFRMM